MSSISNTKMVSRLFFSALSSGGSALILAHTAASDPDWAFARAAYFWITAVSAGLFGAMLIVSVVLVILSSDK